MIHFGFHLLSVHDSKFSKYAIDRSYRKSYHKYRAATWIMGNISRKEIRCWPRRTNCWSRRCPKPAGKCPIHRHRRGENMRQIAETQTSTWPRWSTDRTIQEQLYRVQWTTLIDIHGVVRRQYSGEEMLVFYKKKRKNNRGNYRVLGLLNHSYKVFSMVLLLRIIPYIDPKLSQMQAGIRKNRGCRDNVLIN